MILQKDLFELVPDEIKKAMAVLKSKMGSYEGRTDTTNAKVFRQHNYLRSFTLLNVFGFNSGKQYFDLLDLTHF